MKPRIVILALLAPFFVSTASALPESVVKMYVHYGSVNELFSEQQGQVGSDNWLMVDLLDGRQATVWGDGQANSSLPTSIGVALIDKGSPRGLNKDHFSVIHRGAHKGVCRDRFTSVPSVATGGELCAKSYALIPLDSGLWMWLIDDFPLEGKGNRNYTLVQSPNDGHTWHEGMTVSESNGMISPVFLQQGPHGQDKEHVYTYWAVRDPRTSGFSVHGAAGRPGKIYVTRVANAQINKPGAYHVWDGAKWVSINLQARGWQDKGTPIFKNKLGVGWTFSVSYLPTLRKYILISEHTETFKGKIGFYESSNPIGPWRTISEKHDFSLCFPVVNKGKVTGYTGMGGRAFYGSISQRWSHNTRNSSKFSGQGNSFWLVFTGIGNDDAFNLVRLTIKPRSDFKGVGRQMTCGELVR